jgi:hypothetical protein
MKTKSNMTDNREIKENQNSITIKWFRNGCKYQIVTLEGSDKINFSISSSNNNFPSEIQQILIPVSEIKMLVKNLQSL